MLDTSDDTIEELKREAAKLEERAEAAKHDIVRVKLLATRANILVSLQRMQVYAEAAKKKAGEETPAEELETEALAYLKSRGWTCTRG